MNHARKARVFVIDAFARLLIAVAVAPAARVGDCDPGGAIAKYEAANKHAGTRRNAQSRHPHLLLFLDEMVAD